MLLFFILGAIFALMMYFVLRITLVTYVDNTYNSEEAKKNRQDNYIEELQNFVDENDISSDDTASFAKWLRQNRYIYLLIYKDDELFFSEGSYNNPQVPVAPPFGTEGGFTVDYPNREELIEYAEKNGLYPLELEDGTLFASLADFSEYFYYDIVNIVSLAGAFVVLALTLLHYFRDLTNRITGLRADVSRVSEGDMNHVIKAEGSDELSNLCANVEHMRSTMLVNISREKEAMDANAELITSMSHDIRTPLTVLLGYIDIMKMHAEDEAMQGYIKASEATALRLKELSDDMFKYFLVFGSESEVNLLCYDAKTLFQQLFSEHMLLLHEKGYTFEGGKNWDEDELVKTDAPLVMRLVDNLFSNISKYADKQKPITVNFTKEDKHICITLENYINTSAGTVESSGIGLKTCERIASRIGLDFEYEKGEELFKTTLRFPLADDKTA